MRNGKIDCLHFLQQRVRRCHLSRFWLSRVLRVLMVVLLCLSVNTYAKNEAANIKCQNALGSQLSNQKKYIMESLLVISEAIRDSSPESKLWNSETFVGSCLALESALMSIVQKNDYDKYLSKNQKQLLTRIFSDVREIRHRADRVRNYYLKIEESQQFGASKDQIQKMETSAAFAEAELKGFLLTNGWTEKSLSHYFANEFSKFKFE